MSTDIQITYNKKVYNVPEGFTAKEFVDSIAATDPKAATAQLIDDGGGKYTLKTTYAEKG